MSVESLAIREHTSAMNERPEQELFEGVAEIKAIDAAFVEKDWFVTQVISSLFEFK